MIKARNVSNQIIYLPVLNIHLIPNVEVDLTSRFDVSLISMEEVLTKEVSKGNVIINDGIKDLGIREALELLSNKMVIPSIISPTGKLIVHNSPKPFGYYFQVSGTSDDPSNIYDVGNGNPFILQHDGSNEPKIFYYDFNVIENRTWIQNAVIMFKNCNGERLTVDVVPYTVSWEYAEGTPYYMLESGLIVPSSNGNINILSNLEEYRGGLVYMVEGEDKKRAPSFFDAEWDPLMNRFVNIIPKPEGDGRYNIFGKEIVLYRIINSVTLFGDGIIDTKSNDSFEIGHNIRIRTQIEQNENSNNWFISGLVTIHRKKTS